MVWPSMLPFTVGALGCAFLFGNGNGAVFKRLGFLVSQISGSEALAESCRQRLTQGNAKLDPALPSRRLVKAWRLWIPKTWEPGAERD